MLKDYQNFIVILFWIMTAVAKELKNLVEEQRAMATLGRIYLLQGQSTTNENEAKTSLKAAEKAFMKSLVLCEKLVKPFSISSLEL